MSTLVPSSTDELVQWTWPQIEPHYRELAARPLNAANVGAWLADWSRLEEAVNEMYNRLWVATTVNTADEEAGRRFAAYLDEIFPAAQAAEYGLKKKLIASGLKAEGFEVPLRNMRAEVELFHEANLPLLAEEKKLSTTFDKIVGAQTATWDGKEVTLQQLQPVFLDPDRAKRERAWRLSMERRLADREKINELWTQFLRVRTHIAENAGYDGDYRAYRWKQLLRFDYTPANCETFRRAIEEVAIPAGLRITERNPHSLYISRYQLGRDATVYWPSLDLKFVNDTKSWVLVKGFAESDGVSVAIYGGEQRRVESSPGTITVIGRVPIKRVKDPTLPKGKSVVEEKGSAPSRTSVTRTVYGPNGNVIHDETWTTSYKGEKRIVRVGTKLAKPMLKAPAGKAPPPAKAGAIPPSQP